MLSYAMIGAFLNPADAVARIYREELLVRRAHFDVVAFAIFDPGCALPRPEPPCMRFATLLAWR